ncbi:hypothetical protein Clacol_006670 [Clathrus columnatus]|uniref:Uncharacterized protein n=1 Tax=Clathrus columnatus TaxID=1419009 RepID=A0AAV5AH18_9AGAM|nr:hypothetical protein Clacol_006670 [Clathrus columnatus]
MAGPNLEIFRFGLYLFFPLAIMAHFGNPDWYRRHVLPYKDRIIPKDNKQKLPHTHSEVVAELERRKAERLRRKLENEQS